jgi:hypothetical protein
MKVKQIFQDFGQNPVQPGDQFKSYRLLKSGIAIWREDNDTGKTYHARRFRSFQVEGDDYTFEWETH